MRRLLNNKVPRGAAKDSNTKARMLEMLILVSFVVTLVYVASFTVRATQGAYRERPVAVIGLRVQALNGCGEKGLANKIAEKLSERVVAPLAVEVVDAGNFSIFDIEKSFIISRTPDLADAQLLAAQLGLSAEEVIYVPLEDNYKSIQATLVIGKDFNTKLF